MSGASARNSSAAAERSRTAAAIAALIFALAAPVAYVAQRLYELARSGHVDPALILSSTHTAFYWRAAVASWFGATCAAIALGLWKRREGDVGKLAVRIAVLSLALGLVLVLAAWRFP